MIFSPKVKYYTYNLNIYVNSESVRMISLRGSCRLILGAIKNLRSCLLYIICFLQHFQINKKVQSVMKFYCTSDLSDGSNYVQHRAVDEVEDDRNSVKVIRSGSEKTKPMSALLLPEDLLRIFNVFDKDLDGLISNEDIQRILNNVGLDVSLDHILDVHGSSKSLGFDEFLSLYNSLWNDDQDEEHVDGDNGLECHGELMQAVFRVFDRDGDGYICSSELQQILESLGLNEGRDISVCKTMISKVDINFDGKVDFSEFKQMMLFA